MQKYVLEKISEKLGLKIAGFQVKNPHDLNENELRFFTTCLNEIPSLSFLVPYYSDIALCVVLEKNGINIFLQGFLDLEIIKPNFEKLFDTFKGTIASHQFFSYEVLLCPKKDSNFHFSLTCLVQNK